MTKDTRTQQDSGQSENNVNRKKRYFIIGAVSLWLATSISAFIYGIGVGYFKWFPFFEIREFRRKLLGLQGSIDESYPHIFVDAIDSKIDSPISLFIINQIPITEYNELELYIISPTTEKVIQEIKVKGSDLKKIDTHSCIDLKGNRCEYLYVYDLNFFIEGAFIVSTKRKINLKVQTPNCAFFIKYKSIQNNPKIKVGVVYPDFTWYAYNVYGGNSLYHQPFPIPGDMSSAVSHSMRPHISYDESKSIISTSIFIKQLEIEEIPCYSLTNSRLHSTTDWLNLDLIILTSHDEYWSEEIFDKLKKFIDSGGKLAIFSGNTAWRSFEIKNKSHRRVFNWEQKNQPEQITGLAFRYGGVPINVNNNNEKKAVSLGLPVGEFVNSSGMKVLNKNHPIFKDTNLNNGEYFGTSSNLVWYEIDGIPLDYNSENIDLNRPPKTTPLYDGSQLSNVINKFPKNIQVLASGWLQWFDYEKGIQYAGTIIDAQIGKGRVINGGSVGWYKSIMADDKTVIKIFNNIIRELLASNK